MKLRIGMKAKFGFGYMEIVSIYSDKAIVKYYSPGRDTHNKEGVWSLEFLEELYSHNLIETGWKAKFRYK